ncbi:glycosyltransferase [Polynucleobacter sp. Nonnen-W13]|uniref:glycosyltransferase n=1 Tax=Polynucleobacter sp. Nonnen-W13 TaxID=1855625 RepID=UPI001C0E5155|nr:glycosyltransferase [Polynucleobacter sp. Nonnen-W13]
MHKPLLTILIPVYNYYSGLLRILNNLPVDNEKLEIIICDDSDDIDYEFYKFIDYKIKIILNPVNIGAAKTWNKLLKASNGAYTMIIHHDEFPENKNTINLLIKDIESHYTCDVFVLKYKILKNNKIFNHTSGRLKLFFINNSIAYIIRRNFIGSMSSLIIRSEFYQEFDIKLKWFIDVDLFYRVLMSTKNVNYLNKSIVSEVDRIESITYNVKKNNFNELKNQELMYLANNHGYRYKIKYFIFDIIFYINKILLLLHNSK